MNLFENRNQSKKSYITRNFLRTIFILLPDTDFILNFFFFFLLETVTQLVQTQSIPFVLSYLRLRIYLMHIDTFGWRDKFQLFNVDAIFIFKNKSFAQMNNEKFMVPFEYFIALVYHIILPPIE